MDPKGAVVQSSVEARTGRSPWREGTAPLATIRSVPRIRIAGTVARKIPLASSRPAPRPTKVQVTFGGARPRPSAAPTDRSSEAVEQGRL